MLVFRQTIQVLIKTDQSFKKMPGTSVSSFSIATPILLSIFAGTFGFFLHTFVHPSLSLLTLITMFQIPIGIFAGLKIGKEQKARSQTKIHELLCLLETWKRTK